MSLDFKLKEDLEHSIEEKIVHTLRGIEETLNNVIASGISSDEIRIIIKSLKPGFSVLSQSWVLELLFLLLLSGPMSFNDIKRVLDINSKTLSIKLKTLEKYGFVSRKVLEGPPLRVIYSVTEHGKATALLSIPLLYYLFFKMGKS